MGYIPKFIHFDEKVEADYPFGAYWNHSYIECCAKAIYEVFKEEHYLEFVVRGTSGAMIAGGIVTEIHHINETMECNIIIVRKKGEDANSPSLSGLESQFKEKIIVVDDFISTGETVMSILECLDNYYETYHKYGMLCICNSLDKTALKKNTCIDYQKWKSICSRFEYVVCNKI